MESLWIYFSLIGMLLAGMVVHGKNRNAVGWGMFGLFVPLVAVFLVFVLPPNLDPNKPR
jgi:hypothetical protein